MKRIRKWLRQRRLYRTYPELREIDRQMELARRKHQPVRKLQEAKRQFISSALGKYDHMTRMLESALELAFADGDF